ncbi:PTS sugar transporter subunit IIB [Caproiciproducens faecalis]|uniref:PTS fructose transporter subunit IIB n=1 Tax=Caproiciproducens faecalis TaxID=2820301 RepID=A0ABS7DMY9_9FIRM|nr:PTS fructose transporter subunit IIB [Caproiciproducens faecalis]MBW7572674.1 PTS fructose transporter subunit IIB [Caproiciproducens faecalis]
MRAVRILSVCGSGTVSSAMLSSKLENLLAEHGYNTEATEIAPDALDTAVSTGAYDLIAYTSPVKDIYGIPVLNATGFLVGINEEEFVEDLLEAMSKLDLG